MSSAIDFTAYRLFGEIVTVDEYAAMIHKAMKNKSDWQDCRVSEAGIEIGGKNAE